MSPTYDDLRRQVERRYRRRVFFGLHLTLFIAVCVYLGWWFLTRNFYYANTQHLWLMGVWFVFLAAHGFILRMANARDREIERTWERYGGKRKPELDDYPVYLSDDGERVDWIDETGHSLEKSKRRG